LFPITRFSVGPGLLLPTASMAMPFVALLSAVFPLIVVWAAATGLATVNSLMPSPRPLVPLRLLMLSMISLNSLGGLPPHSEPIGVVGLHVGSTTMPSAPLPVTVLPTTRLLFAAGPSMRIPMSWRPAVGLPVWSMLLSVTMLSRISLRWLSPTTEIPLKGPLRTTVLPRMRFSLEPLMAMPSPNSALAAPMLSWIVRFCTVLPPPPIDRKSVV
jgi:hypothetical protein